MTMELSRDQFIAWNRRDTLVSKLVDILLENHSLDETERFFAWLRVVLPQESSGIDWRRIRLKIAGAAGGASFKAKVALFFLFLADPLVVEYNVRRRDAAVPVFPRTKRPLTAHLDVATTDEFHIRVVRYMDSPTSGIWHQRTAATEHCGTFYYYEPDSVTTLRCARDAVLMAGNKIHAVYMLMQQATDTSALRAALRACHTKLADFNEPNIAAIQSPAFKQYVLALLDALARGDLDSVANHPLLQVVPWGRPRVVLLEDIDHTMRRVTPSDADTGLSVAESFGLVPTYVGYTIWSRLDSLDAALCGHARIAGYKLVVLQSEAGQLRAVSEVLDTRPRHVSFQSLVKLPISVPPDAVFDETAPAVYYPRDAYYFSHNDAEQLN